MASPLRRTQETSTTAMSQALGESESMSSDSGPDPRLVIDITPWPSTPKALDALYSALREDITSGPLRPILLILTDEQYERLPRSYDPMIAEGELRIERVATEDDARRAVMQSAAEPLVMSSWRFDPIERWLAADFDGKSLVLDPVDGLSGFADDGELDGIAEVEHPLAEIAKGDSDAPPAQLKAPLLRACIMALADEEKTVALIASNKDFQDPEKRMTFAQRIGATEVTSLPSERREHELVGLTKEISSALGLGVETVNDSEHSLLLNRAAKRPRPPAAWRHGDSIHLLHADPPRDHPAIIVHRPSPPEPAIRRLLRHIGPWTAHDYERDPALARAVEELVRDDADRIALLHARATLLWGSALPEPKPLERQEEWLEPLRRLLASEPPPAALRVSCVEKVSGERDPRTMETIPEYERLVPLSEGDDELPARGYEEISKALCAPRPYPVRIVQRGGSGLRVHAKVPPTMCINVSEDGQTWQSDDSKRRAKKRSYFGDENDELSAAELAKYGLWLPCLDDVYDVDDLWLDCFERSSDLSGWSWDDSEASVDLLRSLSNQRLRILFPDHSRDRLVPLEVSLWREADLQLGQCWIALREALRRPQTVRLPSGILCSIGGGVSALIEAHTLRDSGAPPLAALDVRVLRESETRESVSLVYDKVWTHHSEVWKHDYENSDYRGATGVRVPARLSLSGEGSLFTISFVASPLLHPLSPVGGGFATAVAKAKDDQDDQDEQDRWDYD